MYDHPAEMTQAETDLKRENARLRQLVATMRQVDPVPEVWRDVTAECDLPRYTSDRHHDHCEVWHGSHRLCTVGNGLVTGYRLRRVYLWTVQPGTNIIGEAQSAFIVEKKEQP